jgi:hypothetical protein
VRETVELGRTVLTKNLDVPCATVSDLVLPNIINLSVGLPKVTSSVNGQTRTLGERAETIRTVRVAALPRGRNDRERDGRGQQSCLSLDEIKTVFGCLSNLQTLTLYTEGRGWLTFSRELAKRADARAGVCFDLAEHDLVVERTQATAPMNQVLTAFRSCQTSSCSVFLRSRTPRRSLPSH